MCDDAHSRGTDAESSLQAGVARRGFLEEAILELYLVWRLGSEKK